MDLGKLGVWQGLDGVSGAAALAFAQRTEKRGFKTLWLPESRGRNVLVTSSWLLAGTKTLNVATGIANIYARDPMAAANGRNALAEFSGNRFMLGLGVSHKPIVTGMRGHDYLKPVATMRAYLEGMKTAAYQAPVPSEKPKTVLAALGPKMLELAREMTDGAHPYCVTPEHTAEARRILGPGKLLCPEVMVLLEPDAKKARAAAKTALSFYVALENYANNWRRLGFTDAEMQGGADRFVDANVAWGDEAQIRKRLKAYFDSGADHVCIQSIHPTGSRTELDERIYDALAPVKGGL